MRDQRRLHGGRRPGLRPLIVTFATSVLIAGCAAPAPRIQPNLLSSGCGISEDAEALFSRAPREVAPDRPANPQRLIDCGPVSLAEREGQVLGFVEDLSITERANDDRYNFDQAIGLAVDHAGRIYVHDSNRYRIVVYAPDGTFERAYGGAGDMAPFRRGWIAVAGDRLAISTGNKITVWSLEGEHLYDRSLLRRAFWDGVLGTDGGALVGPFGMRDSQGSSWYSIDSVDLDADVSFTYGAVSPSAADSSPRVRGSFAVTPSGAVYLTRGDEYLVRAYEPDGEPRWALRVKNAPRIADVGSTAPPALSVPRSGTGRGHALRADGHGNLYVFPYVGPDWTRDEIPVDVYAPNGQRLFAGFAPDVSWLTARGNHIYGIEGEGDAERIVRYRVLPQSALEPVAGGEAAGR